MTKTVAVIDGNSLMHRAYHAVPPTMNAPDGTPTNAVFGFLSMFLKFIDEAHPDAVVCAFDAGIPDFRLEAIKQYKAQRPPMDDALRVQFPLIEHLLETMRVPVAKVEGWEGDDILGTVAARDEQLGYKTMLVSGDKDVYQLTSELTRVMTTKKGLTDVAVYGPDEVFERYGVTPDQFPDYLGLMGDSSDNIPGVPGVGPKTASKLLAKYGTMEGLYEHVDELKGKQRQNVEDNRELAFLSRRVATISRDVDFELDLEQAAFPAFDADEVTRAFRELGMNSQLARVLRLVGAEEAPRAPRAELEVGELVRDAEGAAALLAGAAGRGEVVGAACVEPEQAALFGGGLFVALATSEGVAVLEDDEGLRALGAVDARCTVAAFDVKGLLRRLYPPDSSLPAAIDDDAVLNLHAFDVGLAVYVLDSSRTTCNPSALAEERLGLKLPGRDDDALYAAALARAARLLVEPLTRSLEQDGARRVYFDIDLPLVGVLAVMERTGAAIDCERLAQLGASTQTELDDLTARIHGLAGHAFNIDSPKQLGEVLFEEQGCPHGRRTSRGYSTDASVLKGLARDYELPRLVLRYRELKKIKSTYIDALPAMRAGDGRVHTSFNATATATGRLSSSDPNLQNIPVRTDFGRQIRECFVPLGPGERFLSADYSQIELRLLAHLSGDEHLLSASRSGADFHAATAARVFGVPVEEVTPQLRSRAKAVNFGIVYGQQAYGLSQSLEIPFAEAREMIDRYFEAYPGVRVYLDEVVAQARQRGFAETMFGRRRYIPELRFSNAAQRAFGERTAMNHPMQGSAADIIKLAMREVARRMAAEGFRAKMMLQVHDELDFSVPEEEVEPLASLVKDVMEHAVELRVPLVVDVSWGDTWAQAH